MIVDHRQRMAPAGAEGEMPLEVHLPQLVRRRPLETLHTADAAGSPQVDPAVPVQNRRNRAGARHRLMFEILQPPPDLAPAPGRMLVTNRQHQCLNFPRSARR